MREDCGAHVIENPVHQVIVLGDQGDRLNRHLGIPSVTCHAEVGYVREIIYDLRPADQSIADRIVVEGAQVMIFWLRSGWLLRTTFSERNDCCLQGKFDSMKYKRPFGQFGCPLIMSGIFIAASRNCLARANSSCA